MSRRWMSVIGVVIVAGLAGWAAFERYWYYIPGVIGRLKDPIGPTQQVAWQAGPAEAATGERPPNVVVILADDLGWNDISFNGGGVANGAVPTPHINSIGHAGVSFSQAYAGDATCAPSRAAIMTGRYATRFGFEFTPAPKQFSKLIATFGEGKLPAFYHAERAEDFPANLGDLAVPTSEVMIGDIMKKAGYHTIMLGKWHLGGTPATAPEARGFDEALAFYDGASMYLDEGDPRAENSKQDFDPIDKFLWANLPFAVRYNGGKRFEPDVYMTDYLGREAVRAIDANKNRPFFMYLAFNAVHNPLQALKADYDALSNIPDHRLRVYGAMVRSLDRNVGLVLDALKRNGLDDNTLVIFTSDNGGANYIGLPDINKPFRGWKATFFEGGIHVPFFVKWPGRAPADAKFDKPIGHVDIFATAAAAAAAHAPTDRTLDGVDLMPFARGEANGDPHKTLYWRDGEYRVLLEDGWKLQSAERPRKNWLYNLAIDPTEQNNLAESMPDKVADLQKELAQIDKQQVKPLWPSLLEGPIFIDTPLGTPPKKDGEYIYWAN
ncbi:MAG: sulfatase-like hydrolase/transferase [Hyphomicrobiales bacterium]|nr:sulfatase-like hydrolase/transferase [Hyphomicrobiales bacterium]